MYNIAHRTQMKNNFENVVMIRNKKEIRSFKLYPGGKIANWVIFPSDGNKYTISFLTIYLYNQFRLK